MKKLSFPDYRAYFNFSLSQILMFSASEEKRDGKDLYHPCLLASTALNFQSKIKLTVTGIHTHKLDNRHIFFSAAPFDVNSCTQYIYIIYFFILQLSHSFFSAV